MPSSHVLIARAAPSKRSAVNEFQARHFAALIRLMQQQMHAHFGVRDLAQLSEERIEEFYELDGYALFVEGVYACGFVCRDASPTNPLEHCRGSHAEAVRTLDFPSLRQFVHFLMRAERWNYGYSSPLLCAFIGGVLSVVAERLESDETMYTAL